MPDIRFKIIEHYGILSTSKSGWNKELNLISWNDAEPKFDIRDWDQYHVKMGRGVTLTSEEVEELKKLLNEHLKQ